MAVAKHEQMHMIMDEIAARFILTCPQEEFRSFERLFFQIEAAHWFYIDHYVEHDPTLPSFRMKDFTRLIFKHCPMLTTFQHDVENHVKNFSEYKVGVPVFGAIILNQTLDKCLLVKGWHKNSTWGFPKGKINQNEAHAACAVREVWEEIGYNCEPLLNERDHLKATLNSHEMKLYIIAGVPETTPFATQTTKEISRIEWFYVKDLPTCKSTGTSSFFLVMPFVKSLQEWIKCRKSGKPWTPPASRSKLPTTPTKLSASSKRSDSAPPRVHQQQQQQAQYPSVSATVDTVASSARQNRKGGDDTRKQGEDAPVRILKKGSRTSGVVEVAEAIIEDKPGNHVFGRGFRFNTEQVMGPIRAMG